MGVKHKKTRKEKIIADYRHQVYVLEKNNLPLNNSSPVAVINEKSNFNALILKDVLRTGILTSIIIAAQIIFFFLLKRHIFSIPSLNY
jgi:hypothetical protein